MPDVTDKSPSGNFGRIGKMRDIDRNSLQRRHLSGRARRLSHSLFPINVNVRSILSVTSGLFRFLIIGGPAIRPSPEGDGPLAGFLWEKARRQRSRAISGR